MDRLLLSPAIAKKLNAVGVDTDVRGCVYKQLKSLRHVPLREGEY